MRKTYEDSSFIRLCWDNLLWLIVLNVFFLLCCILVVTIPAACTALCRALQGLLLGEKVKVQTFFKSFRANLFCSLPIGLIFVLGPALIAYGCLFYFQVSQGDGFAVVLSIFCMVCIYIVFCVGLFSFNIMARVELKAGEVIRNAFNLTFMYPKISWTWSLLSFSLFVGMLASFPRSLPLLVLLGGSLPGFAAARGVLPIIDALIVND